MNIGSNIADLCDVIIRDIYIKQYLKIHYLATAVSYKYVNEKWSHPHFVRS